VSERPRQSETRRRLDEAERARLEAEARDRARPKHDNSYPGDPEPGFEDAPPQPHEGNGDPPARKPVRKHAPKTNGRAKAPAKKQPQPARPLDMPVEGVEDPHRLARLYLDDHRHEGELGLRWWREEWHRWEGVAYRRVLDKEVRAAVGARIKAEWDRLNLMALAAWDRDGREGAPVARKVTARLTGDAVHALTGLACVPGGVEQPAWLGGEGPAPAEELLACRGGLLHLAGWAEGQAHLFPPTPRLFTPTALPYDFEADAPEPAAWLEFLRQLWPDDDGTIQALQEWLGYLLLPDTSQQKIALLVGPRRSGKGTIGRVLTQLVGPGNVCSPTLGSLGGPFGLQPLLGKTVALISDARLSGRSDAAVVVERLLSISGEDAQTVDRKHLTAVTGRLPVRLTILTNELPRLSDASGALVGRLVVLRLTRTWYGQEDTRLTGRLLAELPGILLWAMRGWCRLRQRGHFVQPSAAAALVQDMEDLASPVGAFLRERCRIEAGASVAVAGLYQAWRSWCEKKGREPSNEQTFGRDLRAIVPHLDVSQQRTEDGRIRVYDGIRLLPDVPW
jgi:putative DNA primase/helicase